MNTGRIHGKPVDDEQIQQWADDAESGYDLSELQRLASEPGVSDWVSSARSFAASAPPDSADHILTDPEKNRH